MKFFRKDKSQSSPSNKSEKTSTFGNIFRRKSNEGDKAPRSCSNQPSPKNNPDGVVKVPSITIQKAGKDELMPYAKVETQNKRRCQD